ncbi:hypothetical protein PoB_003506700 [Plakobranchus ocellatus]|uniref:Sushi domain-containing protein n=1 Tax=Plakobranchus ocellatus TaxID=259542 RepID=A0AAV4ANR3_9GAST|nr:hypothetical protein PoB_003506700 [Plakobranchus ocellatus]
MASAGSGLCPVLATPQNGIITADNADSLVVSTYDRTPGTAVRISCYWEEVYTIQGNDQVTCVGGRWVPDPPTCVRKNAGSQGDNSTTTTTPDTPSSSDSDTTVIILVSAVCALVVLVLFIILAYRIYSLDRAKSRYKHVKEDIHSDDSLISNPSLSRDISKTRATPFNLSHPGYYRNLSDLDPFTAPPSLWSVPPSYRHFSNYYSNHPHYQQYEQHFSSQPRSPVSISIHATMRGLAGTEEWTYLSADRLLKDIEASRKNNPNHSWRDFASLSTDTSKQSKKPRKT